MKSFLDVVNFEAGDQNALINGVAVSRAGTFVRQSHVLAHVE